MLKKGVTLKRDETLTPEAEIKDSFILEFLGLKDEYSESDLEEALIQQLEAFLLEPRRRLRLRRPAAPLARGLNSTVRRSF